MKTLARARPSGSASALARLVKGDLVDFSNWATSPAIAQALYVWSAWRATLLVGVAEGREAYQSRGECRGNTSLNVVGKPKVFPTVKKTKKVAYALRCDALVNRRPGLWLPRCFVLSHVSGINKTQVVFRSPVFITRHCLTRFSKIRFFVKKVRSNKVLPWAALSNGRLVRTD